MKQKTLIAAAAAIAISMAACTDDDPKGPAAGKTGVTITAGIEKDPQTRISYEKDGNYTKITWDATESFYVYFQYVEKDPVKFDKVGSEAGLASADFACGTDEVKEVDLPYLAYAVYNNGNTVNANENTIKVDFGTQNGTGNDKQIMVAPPSYKGDKTEKLENLDFTFKPKTALLKLTLKNDAFKGETVSGITLSGAGLVKEANYNFFSGGWVLSNYSNIAINGSFTDADNDGAVTLYVAQPTSDNDVGPITIMARCEGVDYMGTLGKDKFDEVAVYTAEVDMTTFVDFMQFTIETTSNFDIFGLPFVGNFKSGVTMAIDWGDGSAKKFIHGNDGSVVSPSHKYDIAGRYTIIISSTADATVQQMPKLKLGTDNYKAKLISMDTPMLNMFADDLSNAFKDCSNLTNIADGLFDKNTAIINFENCFANCIKLTEIPSGLFDGNTEATSFEGCFSSCAALTEVPTLLFANNKDATNFFGTFADCYNLKLNENIFCKESAGEGATRFKDISVDFTDCFWSVGKDLGLGNGGKAPALWTYKFGNGTPTTADCFTGCTNVTNANIIGEAWTQ